MNTMKCKVYFTSTVSVKHSYTTLLPLTSLVRSNSVSLPYRRADTDFLWIFLILHTYINITHCFYSFPSFSFSVLSHKKHLISHELEVPGSGGSRGGPWSSAPPK